MQNKQYQLTLNWDDFLINYWQKRPVVLRKAFPHFNDPISPHELAGLALESEIESRIVSNKNGVWDAKYGPFEEYEHLGKTNWSLLVQAVDHWHEESAKLLAPFKVLPQWLFDDLMVSYATPEGGVGPHIDQYDVFIIQGMGRRRWKVGDINPDYKEYCTHPALLHVEEFSPIIDEEITAGDILYIPAGFPHDGVCLETSLSYSVGFRAPSSKELISNFADYLLDHIRIDQRYSDPTLKLPEDSLQVQSYELSKIQSQMRNLIDDKTLFNDWFGRYITHSLHELNIIPVDPEYSIDDVISEFNNGAYCELVASIRIAKIDDNVFICGEKVNLSKNIADYLFSSSTITRDDLSQYINDVTVMTEITRLINLGYWYFV